MAQTVRMMLVDPPGCKQRFSEAEPRVDRQVRVHLFVGVEVDSVQAEGARGLLAELDQRLPNALPRCTRQDRNSIQNNVVIFGKEDDNAVELVLMNDGDVDMSGSNQRFLIRSHWSRLPADQRHIGREGLLCTGPDRGLVGRRSCLDHVAHLSATAAGPR